MFFAPFLAFYAIIFFFVLAFFFVLLEIHVISYAFVALGLPPEMAFTALLVSLIGSYINIPIARVASGQPHPAEVVRSFGIRYRVPTSLRDRTRPSSRSMSAARSFRFSSRCTC